MNRTRAAIFTVCLGLLPAVCYAGFFDEDTPKACLPGTGVSFETFFSPSAQVSPAVVKAIDNAKKTIRIATRIFVSKPVSEALVRAARAGRDVKIVLDGGNNSTGYSNATFLQTMGFAPHVTNKDVNMYVSYMVIDDSEIFQGNIATLADEEAETKSSSALLVMHNAPDLAKQYLANWQTLWDMSSIMEKRKK